MGGKVIDELVSLMDVPPTLLACAEIETSESMKGKPLQQLTAGKTSEWPEEVFLQISESQVGRAIRTNKWKYSVRAVDKNGWNDSNSDVYHEDFLYDLENDYHEKNNLVSSPEHADIRKELSEKLIKRMVQAGEAAPVILPNTGL